MSLNEEQIKAVTAPFSPALVLAGAGSGKTTVLISRVLEYIKQGIEINRILIITFTNKARDEIKERISRIVPEFEDFGDIFTFHAFFNRVLKKDIEHVDKSMMSFNVVSDSDQRSILNGIVKKVALDVPANLRNIQSAVSKIKVQTPLDQSPDPSIYSFFAPKIGIAPVDLQTIYIEYNKDLKEGYLLDYDDLERYTYKLLDNEDVRKYWYSRFDAILIDEFQDTSHLQFEILKKLLGSDKQFNLFCVGDPDQSIYGFRGAKPQVCSDFLKYFENVKIVSLNTNYRSTKSIVETSNFFINKHKKHGRFLKRLNTPNEQGAKVECVVFSSEFDESKWVAETINKLIQEDKEASFNDFAIIFRSNYLSKPFEIELKKYGWNYKITGSMELFSKLEVKFILGVFNTLFSSVVSPVYLENIKKAIPIGLSDDSIASVCAFSRDNKLSFIQMYENYKTIPSLSTRINKAYASLWELLKKIYDKRELSVIGFINTIVEVFQYESHVAKKEELGRLDNINLLGQSLYASNPKSKSAEDIFESISLASSGDMDKTDAITLSTVHQMKGLEFKYVFVVKVLDGVFPSSKAVSDQEKEEERRLAYVAFTRAKKRLFITASNSSASNPFFIPKTEFIGDISELNTVKFRFGYEVRRRFHRMRMLW